MLELGWGSAHFDELDVRPFIAGCFGMSACSQLRCTKFCGLASCRGEAAVQELKSQAVLRPLCLGDFLVLWEVATFYLDRASKWQCHCSLGIHLKESTVCDYLSFLRKHIQCLSRQVGRNVSKSGIQKRIYSVFSNKGSK